MNTLELARKHLGITAESRYGQQKRDESSAIAVAAAQVAAAEAMFVLAEAIADANDLMREALLGANVPPVRELAAKAKAASEETIG